MKVNNKRNIIVILLITLGVVFLGLGIYFNVSKKENTDNKEETKEPEPETKIEIKDVSENDANNLLYSYALSYDFQSHFCGDLSFGYLPIGGLDKIFIKEGSSVDNYTDLDRQYVILHNIHSNHNFITEPDFEVSFDDYVKEGKKLFGNSYEAKVIQNEEIIVCGSAFSFRYDETNKVFKFGVDVESTSQNMHFEGYGGCVTEYIFRYISGEDDGNTIKLLYKVIFPEDFSSHVDYVNADVETVGYSFLVTFVKDGDNYIFTKSEQL